MIFRLQELISFHRAWEAYAHTHVVKTQGIRTKCFASSFITLAIKLALIFFSLYLTIIWGLSAVEMKTIKCLSKLIMKLEFPGLSRDRDICMNNKHVSMF